MRPSEAGALLCLPPMTLRLASCFHAASLRGPVCTVHALSLLRVKAPVGSSAALLEETLALGCIPHIPHSYRAAALPGDRLQARPRDGSPPFLKGVLSSCLSPWLVTCHPLGSVAGRHAVQAVLQNGTTPDNTMLGVRVKVQIVITGEGLFIFPSTTHA